MINKKPPFEITHKIINYVAEIAELVDRLTVVSPLSTSLTLRHANCIETILDPLAIEQPLPFSGTSYCRTEQEACSGSAQGYCRSQECL